MKGSSERLERRGICERLELGLLDEPPVVPSRVVLHAIGDIGNVTQEGRDLGQMGQIPMWGAAVLLEDAPPLFHLASLGRDARAISNMSLSWFSGEREYSSRQIASARSSSPVR
ncbi:MAG TPA: hypothetical protein VLK65_18660 [Vicinamibacteria bacterium]|nr:hypothetical protein [Vicinamibacteria bacterium]